jgi:hypothetical protein
MRERGFPWILVKDRIIRFTYENAVAVARQTARAVAVNFILK